MDPRNILAWSLPCAIFASMCGCGGDQQISSSVSTDTTTTDSVAAPFDASNKPADPPFVPEDEAETTKSEAPERETAESETKETPTESATEDPFDGGTATKTPATEPVKAEAATEMAKDEPAPASEHKESDESPAPDQDESKSTATPDAADRVITGDWPCWGGSIGRNMVNATTGISIDFRPSEDPKDAKKVLWSARLGSQTYGNPVVAGGKVLIGTNNGAEYRPKHEGDRGCLLCFDEKTGEFLWQLTREKLEEGRAYDWPDVGICSTPFVEGDRVWLVTNRCELICLDLQGFHDDGENDGPFTGEVDTEKQDADIVWVLDMFNDLGVRPHNRRPVRPLSTKTSSACSRPTESMKILTRKSLHQRHLASWG